MKPSKTIREKFMHAVTKNVKKRFESFRLTAILYRLYFIVKV